VDCAGQRWSADRPEESIRGRKTEKENIPITFGWGVGARLPRSHTKTDRKMKGVKVDTMKGKGIVGGITAQNIFNIWTAERVHKQNGQHRINLIEGLEKKKRNTESLDRGVKRIYELGEEKWGCCLLNREAPARAKKARN